MASFRFKIFWLEKKRNTHVKQHVQQALEKTYSRSLRKVRLKSKRGVSSGVMLAIKTQTGTMTYHDFGFLYLEN